MAQEGPTAAKQALEQPDLLPQFAIISIRNQTPDPRGKVEVTPNAGRIVFQNNDPIEYRIRFFPPGLYDNQGQDPNKGGIDLLVPASGSLSLIIKKDEAFSYSIMNLQSENAMTGKGGGPGTN
jgi:hypothetical protein